MLHKQLSHFHELVTYSVLTTLSHDTSSSMHAQAMQATAKSLRTDKQPLIHKDKNKQTVHSGKDQN